MTEQISSRGSTKGKKKISNVMLSWIICLAIYVVIMVLCTIPFNGREGGIDLSVSVFFVNLAEENPLVKSFGQFFKPDLFKADPWTEGNIGQLPSYIVIILFVYIIFAAPIAKARKRKKAMKEYIENNPGYIAEMLGSELETIPEEEREKQARKKLKKQVKYKRPGTMKYYKYAWVLFIVAVFGAFVMTHIFKEVFNRNRPNVLSAEIVFIPWYYIRPLAEDGGASFISGHTSQSFIVAAFCLCFLGSKRKWLASMIPLLGMAYVVCMALARIITNDHYLTDVASAAFFMYTLFLFIYYKLVFIPDQEKLDRLKEISDPHVEGYNMVLEGKQLIKEDKEAAMALIVPGLEKLKEALERIEILESRGHDYAEKQSILERRIAALEKLIAQQAAAASAEKYAHEWTYVF